jgi:DDE domain
MERRSPRNSECCGARLSPFPCWAVDQYGQVIDVLLSEQRDTAAARRFFTRALVHGPAPVEITTDKAGPYLRVLDELVPAAAHVTEQYGNNRVEADHARLKARLRPMRGLKRFRSAAVIAAGHAFVQNLRRGHYELATDAPRVCCIERSMLILTEDLSLPARPTPSRGLRRLLESTTDACRTASETGRPKILRSRSRANAQCNSAARRGSARPRRSAAGAP